MSDLKDIVGAIQLVDRVHDANSSTGPAESSVPTDGHDLGERSDNLSELPHLDALRVSRAIENAAVALQLAADLNLCGDDTTLPCANLTDGSRGPWGFAFDCAGACLADVFDAAKVTYMLDRAINTGEHDAAALRAYAKAWDQG